MSRKFIATIVASAVAVTGIFSAPARASEQDIIKLLFGVATIYAISRALDDDTPAATTPSYPHDYVHPRPLPPRAHRFDPIPARCLKRVHTDNGSVRMISQRCVRRHYPMAHRLPSACRITVHTYKGVRHGYKRRCLRKKGFELAQH